MSFENFNISKTQSITVIWAFVASYFALFNKNNTKQLDDIQTDITLLNSKVSRYLEDTHQLDVRVSVIEAKEHPEN